MSTYEERIAELQRQIDTLRAEKEADLKARRETVVPVYKFTLKPADLKGGYDKIMDDSVVVYELSGEVLNKDELTEVGRVPNEGSMKYFFNTLSGKFITSFGGGNVWISDSSWAWGRDEQTRKAADESATKAWRRLEAFVKLYPAGGNVTEIIDEHRAETNKS